jgi:putative oxygen-independent coproporphyrinogen III oxidase
MLPSAIDPNPEQIRSTAQYRHPASAGLYVHVPFCLTRCGYCDFNTYAGIDHLRLPYVDALRQEVELAAPDWSGTPFVSVFLGGGTPTTLPIEVMRGLLDCLRAAFAVTDDAEVTSEANPDTVDEAYLRGMWVAGVDRLSLGLQSFDPAVLRSLERLHSAESAVDAFRGARRAGFEDVNLDLIYGAEGETLASWRSTLERTVALEPDHVSAYALTIEPATALGRKVAAGLAPAPDGDVQADMYAAACEVLGAAGYEHYEVSNWARPGHHCVHNVGYWEGRPYLGLGAGAHSYREGVRWWNVRPPQQFIDEVAAGRLPIGGEEFLSDDERRLERLLLGLRTSEGVPEEWVGGAARADDFVAQGLAARRAGRIALTDRGMLLANDLVLQLSG